MPTEVTWSFHTGRRRVPIILAAPMHRTNGSALMLLGLLLGCAPTPSEVVGTGDGGGSSTSTASTSGTMLPSTSDDTDPQADATGSATGLGTDTSSDGGTSQGVQPDTSTGEVTTGEITTGGTTTTGSDPSSTSTGTDLSTGADPSCDALFGTAPGYLYCTETPDACHFNADTGGGNCNQMCASLDSTCVAAFDNSHACTIIRPNMDTCETNRSTEICACAK